MPDPTILELGYGHGRLSRALLEMHPTVQVTVTDIEPTSVAAIAAGDLGRLPAVPPPPAAAAGPAYSPKAPASPTSC